MLNTGVYCIENVKNGKKYVGSTSEGFEGRWGSHRKDLNKGVHVNRHLQYAWNKYGEAAFVFKIVKRCKPENCIKNEQYYLDKWQTWKRENGYNLCPTAGSVLGLKWSEQSKKSQETKRVRRFSEDRELALHCVNAMNESNRRNGPTDAQRAARSLNLSVNRMYRGGNSEETRAAISLATKGVPKTEKARENITAAIRKRLKEKGLTTTQKLNNRINSYRSLYTRFGIRKGYKSVREYIAAKRPEYIPILNFLEQAKYDLQEAEMLLDDIENGWVQKELFPQG